MGQPWDLSPSHPFRNHSDAFYRGIPFALQDKSFRLVGLYPYTMVMSSVFTVIFVSDAQR